MKSSSIVVIVFCIATVVFVLYTLTGGQSNEEYAKDIQREREEKEIFMKNSEESPFAKYQDKFHPLNYFQPDLKFKINARLVPIAEKKMIQLSASDGVEKHYLEDSYAEFTLNGVQNKLLILEVVDTGVTDGTLFLAFADGTSAKETYGAGRYLDVKKTPGSKTILLDFNKAYNPYCAYVDDFSCPFPPKENILGVAITAGEKSFHE